MSNTDAKLEKNALSLMRDPQAWISMLALVTLLGLSSGALESGNSPHESLAASSAPLAPATTLAIQQNHQPPESEQLASLDASKL